VETTEEITSAIKNMRYYAEEIKKLCHKQLELDFQNYEMNEVIGQDRLTILGIISGALPHIENWLVNIEVNLVSADKLEPPRKELLEEAIL
jgi:hypothetical protein